MSRRGSVLERWAANVLLLLCGTACLLVSQATRELEHANQRREEQLLLLRRILVAPETVPPGPVAALDGLYDRRIARVTTPHGPAIGFADDLEQMTRR